MFTHVRTFFIDMHTHVGIFLIFVSIFVCIYVVLYVGFLQYATTVKLPISLFIMPTSSNVTLICHVVGS